MDEAPSVLCCGATRATPYCPECGKALLNPSPLVGLLKHCRATMKLKYTRLAEKREHAENPPHTTAGRTAAYYQREVERAQKVAEKWRIWTDELHKHLLTAPPREPQGEREGGG